MFGEVAEPTLGPLGKVFVATGQLPFSADVIGDHDAPHAVYPPDAVVSVEFGEHLAGVCVGCHGQALDGGVIPGGDPSWAPAANLTPHDDGLAGWSYEQFVSALRETVGPNGVPLRAPMDMVARYAAQMTDTELSALWAYVQSIPALPGN